MSVQLCQQTNLIQEVADAFKSGAGLGFAIEFEQVMIKLIVKVDGGLCFHAAEVHGYGTIERQAQGVIAIAPVLDEGDVRMGDCGGFQGHGILRCEL